MIKEALGQVISVTGDLHSGLLHLLAYNYLLLYPSLIQPIQNLLGWKQICGSDITKCYKQAAVPTIMLVDELERKFLTAYFNHVCSDATLI